MCNKTRFAITPIILFVFLIQSFAGPAFANKLTPDPEHIYEISPNTYSVSDLPNEEKKMLENLVQEPLQVTLELMALMKALGTYVSQLEELYGYEDVIKRITSREEKREISIKIDGVGKAELKALGVGEEARVFTRIVHFKTQNAYLFINQEEVSIDYLNNHDVPLTQEDYEKEHKLRKFLKGNLKQYIARQLMAAGSERYAYETLEGKNFDPVEYARSLPLSEKAFHHDSEITEEQEMDLPRRRKLLNKAWELLFADPPEKEHVDTQKGRDAVVVWYHHKGVEKSKQISTPKNKLSFIFWKEYWNKIWEKPQFNEEFLKEKGLKKAKVLFSGDFALALGSASSQGLVALGMAYGLHEFVGKDMSYALPVLSIIWGGVIGVFNKTYRNIVYDGSHLAQTIKGWMVSLSFSYTYILLTHGSDALFALNLAALYTNFHLWTNNLLTNWAKTWWNQFTRNRVLAGELLDDFEGKLSDKNLKKLEKNVKRFKLGEKHYDKLKSALDTIERKVGKAKIERAGVSSQTYYLGSFVLKLFDLIDTRFSIPGFGESVPLGRILFVLSIPMVRWAVIKNAEKHKIKIAPQLRQEWENDKLLGVPYLNFVRKQIPQMLGKAAIITLRIPLRTVYITGREGVKLYKKVRDSEFLKKLNSKESQYKYTYTNTDMNDSTPPSSKKSKQKTTPPKEKLKERMKHGFQILNKLKTKHLKNNKKKSQSSVNQILHKNPSIPNTDPQPHTKVSYLEMTQKLAQKILRKGIQLYNRFKNKISEKTNHKKNNTISLMNKILGKKPLQQAGSQVSTESSSEQNSASLRDPTLQASSGYKKTDTTYPEVLISLPFKEDELEPEKEKLQDKAPKRDSHLQASVGYRKPHNRYLDILKSKASKSKTPLKRDPKMQASMGYRKPHNRYLDILKSKASNKTSLNSVKSCQLLFGL